MGTVKVKKKKDTYRVEVWGNDLQTDEAIRFANCHMTDMGLAGEWEYSRAERKGDKIVVFYTRTSPLL